MFYLLIILLSPITIITSDFLLKSAYLIYWNIIFKNRFSFLYRNIKNIKIRRISTNGNYILSLKSPLTGRYIEYIGDKLGHIKLLGVKPKITKTILNEKIHSPLRSEIPQMFMQDYKNIISNYNKDIAKKYDISVPKGIVIPQNLKIIPQDNDKNKIRVLSIKTFNKRKKTEPDLYKIINFSDYIRECVEKQLTTQSEMNNLITELIYNKIYGYN